MASFGLSESRQAGRPPHMWLALALSVLPKGMAEVGSVPWKRQPCECKPRAGRRGFAGLQEGVGR